MPYNANIPQATDKISTSQNDILNNFQTINTWVNVDHGGLNGAVGIQGAHLKVSLPLGPNPPTNMFNANANGFFCAAGSFVPAIQQTYAYIQVQGPANRSIPFTESILATNAAPANATSGWTYLPSGIILKWGTSPVGLINVNSGGVLGPNFSSLFSFVCSSNGAPQQTFIVAVGLPNVTVTGSVGGGAVFWQAIGR